MNWSIYGWALLGLYILGIIVTTTKQKDMSYGERVYIKMFWLMFYMPLIGHLIGWW